MSIKDRINYLYYKTALSIYDQSKLKSKVAKDIGVSLFLVFIVSYILYLITYTYIIPVEDPRRLYMGTLFYVSNLILIILVLNYTINKSMKKHVLDRFTSMQEEISQIQSGDLSKRLTITTNDEIDQRSYLINTLLDKLQELIQMEQQCALIDPLTSCYNRRAMERNFESILSNAKRKKELFSIAIIDLDFFKKVNDTYGHAVGDKVLVAFANTVRETLRGHDVLYRIGGEEFVIFFANIKKGETSNVLERLRKKVPYKIKKYVEEISSDITMSCGFVLSSKYKLDKKDILSEMIDDADKLLYQAKESGRNKVIGKDK